jgi:hypothetical protein
MHLTLEQRMLVHYLHPFGKHHRRMDSVFLALIHLHLLTLPLDHLFVFRCPKKALMLGIL